MDMEVESFFECNSSAMHLLARLQRTRSIGDSCLISRRPELLLLNYLDDTSNIVIAVCLIFLEKLLDLFRWRQGSANGNVMVQAVDNSSHIFAHVCFNVPWTGQQFCRTVI